MDGNANAFPMTLGDGRSKRYALLGRLAIGGMAELYLARALAGQSPVVVLKRMLPHLARDAEFRRMFHDEAHLAAKLHHPNIVQVHDIGTDGADAFFTMEYVHGENLRTLLKAALQRGEQIPLAHVLTIALGVTAALHYAHERKDERGQPLRIVHRDVSPTNVLVGHDGSVKLVDFGIAKAAAATHITQAGMLKGKASYMSPEQCRAEPVDRRSDVFALGILLFEVSTLSRLFRGDNELVILNQVLTGQITAPSERRAGYPAELEGILLRALQLDPNARYQTAYDLQQDLERFARAHALLPSREALARYVHELVGFRPLPWNDADDLSTLATWETRIGTNVDPLDDDETEVTLLRDATSLRGHGFASPSRAAPILGRPPLRGTNDALLEAEAPTLPRAKIPSVLSAASRLIPSSNVGAPVHRAAPVARTFAPPFVPAASDTTGRPPAVAQSGSTLVPESPGPAPCGPPAVTQGASTLVPEAPTSTRAIAQSASTLVPETRGPAAVNAPRASTLVPESRGSAFAIAPSRSTDAAERTRSAASAEPSVTQSSTTLVRPTPGSAPDERSSAVQSAITYVSVAPSLVPVEETFARPAQAASPNGADPRSVGVDRTIVPGHASSGPATGSVPVQPTTPAVTGSTLPLAPSRVEYEPRHRKPGSSKIVLVLLALVVPAAVAVAAWMLWPRTEKPDAKTTSTESGATANRPSEAAPATRDDTPAIDIADAPSIDSSTAQDEDAEPLADETASEAQSAAVDGADSRTETAEGESPDDDPNDSERPTPRRAAVSSTRPRRPPPRDPGAEPPTDRPNPTLPSIGPGPVPP